MAFGNRVLTTTQDKLMPKVVDTVLGSNVFATRMLSTAERWSGEQVKFPIKVSKNTTGQSFSGFDLLSTSPTNNRQLLAFSPKFEQITVALPLDELSANATDEQVLDLAAIELATSAQDMADNIGTKFYGDGTGNSGKDFLGLGAIVDDGTSVATIGGLSRSTYTTLQSTVTSLSALSLTGMRTLYNSVTSGSQKPSLGLATEAVFGFYEQLLQPQERIMKNVSMMKNGMEGGTGFTGLHYMGFPILADEKVTSQQMIFLNEDYVMWKALPMAKTTPIAFRSQDVEGNDYSEVQGLGFSWSDWIIPSNQAAVVGHIYLGGELCTNNPKRHGKLTNVAGV